MKKRNQKGFTIVELVIVIAVIAILAAVLIPNLSRLVEKANESKALQEAENAMKADLVEANADYKTIGDEYYVVSVKEGESVVGYFKDNSGKTDKEAASGTADANTVYYAKYQGTVTVTDGEAVSYQYIANGYTSTFTIATGAWKTVKN